VKKLKIVLLALALTLTVPTSSVEAADIEDCRIAASSRQIVSLGFPLRIERLANLSKPNILILPYAQSDEAPYTLTDQEKGIFLEAGRNIYEYSNGQNQINFKFNPTIKIEESTNEINDIKRRQQTSWGSNDYENSTFGFVSRVIRGSDHIVDYSGIDAVVLFGNSTKRTEDIAEAMMYTNDPQFLRDSMKKPDGTPWFSTVKTSEGEVNNAILLYNRNDARTVTHELMHLYGLTDLYGSQLSPRYSMMVDVTNSLFPFEKWTLGWLPNSNIQCVSEKDEISSNSTNNQFSINYSNGDQSIVIPTGSTSGLIVDVFKSEFGKKRLIFYSLENEDRPPIKCYSTAVSRCGEIVLDGFAGIGTHLSSPNYDLLITENDGIKVTVNLIPKSQLQSDDFNQLLQYAQNNLAIAKERAKNLQIEASKVAASKTVAKEKTIVCLKGKSSLRVVGKNSKCPTGYKKKV
jgi:hypothetical protein